MKINKLKLQKLAIVILLLGIPLIGFSQIKGNIFLEGVNVAELGLDQEQLAKVQAIKNTHPHKEVYGGKLNRISKILHSENASIPIKLPGYSQSLVAFPKNFEYYSEDDYQWYGEFKKIPGDLLIVCQGGVVFGRISVGGQVFELRTFDEDYYIIIEYDMPKLNSAF